MSRSPVRLVSASQSVEERESGPRSSPSQVRLKATDNDGTDLLSLALRVALESQSDAAWDEVERLCDELERPEPVADAYLRALAEHPDGQRDAFARRVHDFHERWFGDDLERMRRLFTQLLDALPGAAWAFEGLSARLTVAGRWDELLDAYEEVLTDRRIAGPRRVQLLSDAVHVAKDFADRPERALFALRELMVSGHLDLGLSRAFERCLRERGLYRPLLSLWQAMLDAKLAVDERALRLERSALLSKELGEPSAALDELRKVLAMAPGDPEACTLVAGVLTNEAAPAALRLDALALLRLHHDSAARPRDVVDALEAALAFADKESALSLYRELGSRRTALGDWSRAMEDYAALLRLLPGDVDARLQLRLLAERSGEHERHARALEGAAQAATSQVERADLLLSAMHIHARELWQIDEAVALGQRVMALAHSHPTMARDAALCVAELLSGKDREAERLEALERLCASEEHAHVRAALNVEIAAAHRALGDHERALALWEAELSRVPDDEHALSHAIEACEALGRSERLVVHLAARAKLAVTPGQKRRDWVRAAELCARELGRPEDAVDFWFAVRAQDGDDPEVLEALDCLLASVGRYGELTQMLTLAGDRERKSSLVRLCRLGDVSRTELDDPEAAARAYARALELEPSCQAAREGLVTLLLEKRAVQTASQALDRAYLATDDWQKRVDLLDARLTSSDDAEAQAHWMLDIARVLELRANEPARALSLVGRALTRMPLRMHVERELLRLAESTGRRREAAQALHWAAAVASSDRERAADLSALEARLLEDLGDAKGAAEAYQQVVNVRPDAHAEVLGLVRSAALSGAFGMACQAVTRYVAQRGALDGSLLDALEVPGLGVSGYVATRDALRAAIRGAKALSPEVEAGLELRLAHLCLGRCDDLAGAEDALCRALAHRPRDEAALSLLAEVQRRTESPGLFQTLLELDTLAKERGLPLLVEAARRLPESTLTTDQARRVLERLYARASEAWLAHGQEDARAHVLHAFDRLLAIELTEGRIDAALCLCEATARLPVAAEQRLALRTRVVELLAQKGDLAGALSAGSLLLAEHGQNPAYIRDLASIAANLGRIPEELALRKAELSCLKEPAERLDVRLRIVRLTELLEARDARITMLKQNLDDVPGHVVSLEAAVHLLRDARRDEERCALLEGQARALAQRNEAVRAARLFSEAGDVAAHALGDVSRAMALYESSLALVETSHAIDELVRLSRGQDGAVSAVWLEHKLRLASERERPEVVVELARVKLRQGDTDTALSTLRAEFERRPERAAPATQLLVDVLRDAGRDEELGSVLLRLASRAEGEEEVLPLARDAARLFHRALAHKRLVRTDALVEAADLALGYAPHDVELCGMAAEALSALGRHGDAQKLLLHSLHHFGRRRSPERGLVHVQLATVHRAAGQLSDAMHELEQALAMRPDDATIIERLADLAGEANDLPRRERALRALYVSARRGPVALAEGRTVGVCEVLFMLAEVAHKRGDEVQAKTLGDSALVALRLDDPECARVKEALAARGETRWLESIVRAELRAAATQTLKARATLELADLLERAAERKEELLALRLDAVNLDPRDPRVHAAALASVKKHGSVSRYRQVLEGLRERLRRPSDAFARCEVCLRLAALRAEAGDQAGAERLLAEAEATGAREGDVWRAQLDLAMQRGDTDAQERLLKQLEGLGGGELEGESRIEVQYRLAEIRLSADETRAEGLERMRDIVRSELRPVRAARILLRARRPERDDHELIGLLREIARASGELELVQVAELCAERDDEVALEVLLEEAEASQREALSPAPHVLRASLLLSRARLLVARGIEPERRIALLEQALALRPGDGEVEQLLFAQYRATGRAKEALAQLAARARAALGAGDGEASAKLVLSLHLEGAETSELLPLFEGACELLPAHVGLREAWLSHLANAQPRMRAEAIESALQHAAMREPAELALEAAELLRGLSDTAGATRLLTLGRARAPRHLPLLRAFVEALRVSGTKASLAQALEELAGEEPLAERRASLYVEASRLYVSELSDKASALRLLTAAVEARGNDANLRRALADALLEQGQTARAIEQLGHAAAHSKKPSLRAEHLRTRAALLTAVGDLSRALADLDEGFALDPAGTGDALTALLESVRQSDDRDASRKASSRLVALHRARGDAQAALNVLEAQLEDDPEDEAALVQCAALYDQLGQVDKLARVLAAQLERASADSRPGVIALRLGQLLPRVRESAFVRRALERAYQRFSDDASVEEAVCAAREAASDHRGLSALLLARAAKAEDMGERLALLRRAAEQLLLSDAVGEAAEILFQIRASVPGDVDTALTLVDGLLARQRFGEARLLIDSVSERTPETTPQAHARVLVRLARTARGQGDGAAALAYLQSARDTDKTSRVILAELAVVAEELSAWDVAEKALTSLLLLNDAQAMPRAEILLRRARVARHHAGNARALMWAKKALEIAPSSSEAGDLVRELEAAS